LATLRAKNQSEKGERLPSPYSYVLAQPDDLEA